VENEIGKHKDDEKPWVSIPPVCIQAHSQETYGTTLGPRIN